MIRKIILGMLSGLSLYILLLIGDYCFGTNTVRLLLNIDFLTHQKEMVLWKELLPHFIVSIILFSTLEQLYRKGTLFKIALLITILVFILLYFLLINIAVYQQYSSSLPMFLVWMVGHVIYLYIVYQFMKEENHHANF